MRGIANSLIHKEIYFLVIFFILDGLINPDFQSFTYFFRICVIGISKAIIAIITLLGQVSIIFGVLLYEQFLKLVEVRWLIFWGVIVNIFKAFFNYALAMRWN
jgi:Na+/melibiose symporter-like transporter